VGLLGAPRFVLRALGVDALQLGDPRRRRVLGELAGEQVVPRVAARDVHDVATQTQLLDVLEEDDLHYAYLPGNSLVRIEGA